ncbi:orotate phosphoribosyltransferase [Candidatus Zixiibacteriota bacterium]
MTTTVAAEQLAADREKLRRALIEHAVRRGKVILASGKESDFYVNAKQISLHGERLLWAARLLWEKIAPCHCDAIGGLTLGADPLIGAVCLYSAQVGQPKVGLIVRKEPKGHGTLSQIEGPLQAGMKVALIEDVTTTGGSAIKAGKVIEAAGGKIVLAVSILNRREGADEAFAKIGWEFDSLFIKPDLEE